MSRIHLRALPRIALLFLAVAALVLPAAWWLTDGKFRRYEIDTATRDAARLQLTVANRAESIQRAAYDYAHWTLSADYVLGKHPGFIAENLYADNLRIFDADFYLIADAQGRLISSGARPGYLPGSVPGDESLVPLPASAAEAFLRQPIFQHLLRSRGSLGTYLHHQGEWYLIGAGSISYPDDANDPRIHGLFAWVSKMTPERLAKLSKTAGLGFRMQPPPFKPADETTSIDHRNVVAVRALYDTSKAITGSLRMQYPRPLLAQMQVARWVLILATLGTLTLGGMLTWSMVEKGVVRRLLQIDHDLALMRGGDKRLLRASENGDEIDHLARGINTLHIELSRANARWQRLAQHDALTGLGNRSLLTEKLGQPPADPSAASALLLLDLDDFKSINQLFGHAGGDRILREVADCIRQHLPVDAHGFRLGADEFALLFNPSRADQPLALAERLAQAISGIATGRHLGAPVRAHVGVACTRLADDTRLDPSELLKSADIALQQLKRYPAAGDIALFDASMQATNRRSHQVERSLREALARGEIEAWFQPIVSAGDGRLLRLEALARWSHPELGRIEPALFVDIAERNGMSPQLDLYMLSMAARALGAIRTAAPGVAMSVNVSARSLIDDHYLQRAPRLIAEIGLDGRDVLLEITETALIDNESMLTRPLQSLSANGLRIQLDDFGVGYSSLSRLSQIDPVGIKLDGSFTRNRHLGGEPICRAIAGMARQLDMPITAEFVETADDARFLRDIGCDALQGYWISPPLPLAALLAWIGERPRQWLDPA